MVLEAERFTLNAFKQVNIFLKVGATDLKTILLYKFCIFFERLLTLKRSIKELAFLTITIIYRSLSSRHRFGKSREKVYIPFSNIE